jgi:multimeric flavodoxin WrbA
MCVSCHNCFIRGEEFCPHYGIMKGVQAAFADCDGVVLSGPTYLWALNAAMKNFLDHMAFGFHRPAFFGKKGLVVSTSAGAGEKGVAKYLKRVLGQMGINGATIVTRNARDIALVPKEKAEAKLKNAAERFYQSMASKRQIAPSLTAITVHNAFRAMSLGEYAGSERDAQFWRREGYKDRAYPVYAGWKYAAGAIVCACVRTMTKMIGRK